MDSADAAIHVPPLSMALIKVSSERVRKNMVGISTSIRGVWENIYGIPQNSTPAKNPVSSFQSAFPVRYVHTTVNENKDVVRT